MALEAETKRIVAQFEYTDQDINNGVQEFLRQMRKYAQGDRGVDGELPRDADFLSDEGLEKDGTSLSQIPSYVTAVPNGTEKVSPPTDRRRLSTED